MHFLHTIFSLQNRNVSKRMHFCLNRFYLAIWQLVTVRVKRLTQSDSYHLEKKAQDTREKSFGEY